MYSFKFNVMETNFSLVNAFGCARVSSLAYKDANERKRTAKEWGFYKFSDFTRGPHFGILLGNEDMILVAFRGTDELADWKSNLNIFFKRSPLGWVHRGFMKATELFWPELPQRISEFRDRNQDIWITGHSLGGALAVLAVAKLLDKYGLHIRGLYTFGQPPVGTLRFGMKLKEKFSNRYFRFVNQTDAVSDLPIFFRYHTGEVRYFDTIGSLWFGDPPWRVSLLDHIRAPIRFGGLSQFTAHSMKNYVGILSNLLSEEDVL
jgi:triacylglycerol lipase